MGFGHGIWTALPLGPFPNLSLVAVQQGIEAFVDANNKGWHLPTARLVFGVTFVHDYQRLLEMIEFLSSNEVPVMRIL